RQADDEDDADDPRCDEGVERQEIPLGGLFAFPLAAPGQANAVDTGRKAQRLATPGRPARSWMNCHATRPERAPLGIDPSIASARSASVPIGSRIFAA